MNNDPSAIPRANGCNLRRVITLGVILVMLTLLVYPLASVYREIRKERVVTSYSVEIHIGVNLIQVRLPEGTYLCVVSGSEQLLHGIGSITPIISKASLIAFRGNVKLGEDAAKGWMKFHVNDDTYQPISLKCNVSSIDPSTPLFLSIGGTF